MRPLADVREKVAEDLRRAAQDKLDEATARQRYDERLAEKYKDAQVHARHVLIKVAADATPEIKQAKREIAEKVRQLLAGGKDFAEVAKEFSEDEGSKEKGGDLGWFGKGRMVKPFEDAAWPLKDNELSAPVESTFGWHVIQKLGQRDTPFEDVRRELASEVRRERDDAARKAARTVAHKFAVEVYRAVGERTGKDAVAEFRRFAQAYQPAPLLKDSEPFALTDRFVVGIEGFSADLVAKAAKLTNDSPISEMVDNGSYMYVACLESELPPREPTFEEAAGPIRSDLVKDKALTRAREAAKKTAEDLKAKLAAGKPWAEVKSGLAFQSTGQYSPRRGLQHPDSKLILEVTQNAPTGTLAAARDTPTGALLIYLAKREPPTFEMYEQYDQFAYSQVLNSQLQATAQRYEKQLDAKAQTKVAAYWQSALTPRQPGEPTEPAPEE